MLYGIISMILSFAGFFALAFSMDRHYQQLKSEPLNLKSRIMFRAAGWVLLAVSILPCTAHWDTAIGLSVWFGVLSVSGSLLVMLLSYIPAKKYDN